MVFPIVSSGAALIFAASSVGTSAVSLLPPLAAGGLGLLGIGKLAPKIHFQLIRMLTGMASQMICLGPVNCETRAGQCCAFVTLRNRVVCPNSY